MSDRTHIHAVIREAEQRETLDRFRAHIGAAVVYTPPGCGPDCAREQGVVTGVNASFVFVRYGADLTPKATAPQNLRLLAREVER